MPQTNYTGRAMLKLTTFGGQQYLWSTSADVMSTLEGDERAVYPFVSLLQDDRDRSGSADTLAWSISVPYGFDGNDASTASSDADRIASVEFLPTLQYSLSHPLLYVAQEVAPFVQFHFPPLSGVGALDVNGGHRPQRLRLDGDLRFVTSAPLESSWWIRYDVAYRRSLLDDVRDGQDVADITTYAAYYATRNESVRFDVAVASQIDARLDLEVDRGLMDGGASVPDVVLNDVIIPASTPVATAASTSSMPPPPRELHVVISMRVLPATVDYVPSLPETLKAAWIQYFCIAFVVQWLYNVCVRRLLVKLALVNTIAIYSNQE